jgi:putative lipoic acid-binding regulatory protein
MDEAVEQQLIALVQQLARALIRHEAQTSPRCCWRPSSRGWPCSLPPSRGSP